MSKISKILRRCPEFMRAPPEKEARIICGLEEEMFDDVSLARMACGSRCEPIVRAWDAHRLRKTIREVGVGVWKWDSRFRGSMDGDIDDDDFCEYKVPQYMYAKLIAYMEAVRLGYTPPADDYSHIFESHYDQITGNGVIHGKKHCNYVVSSYDDSKTFYQWIHIDQNHWDTVLYPPAVAFYETYVRPLMWKHDLKRIDPYVPGG